MTREDAVRQLFDRTVALSADQRTVVLEGQADQAASRDIVSQTRMLLTAATVISGGSTAPPPVPPTPERVGRYEITGVLGQGGFGIVYRGHDTVLKRPVAIKTCISDDPARREEFVHEAEISARLQHPNIVTIYDFGVEDGLPYLVQEYLSGEDMSDTIRQRDEPPEVEQRAKVLEGVAKGLAHAHRHDVIHRDIKPGNVRLTDTGAIKLLDFGIARLLQHHGDVTSEQAAAGTIGYLAPELLEGHIVGKPADIFSFGAMAFEWLTGQRAFHGESFSEVAYSLLFRPVDLAPLRRAGAAESLIQVVARCLEKDPEDRFTDAEDLAGHLRELTTSGSLTGAVEALPEPPPEREPPPVEPMTAPRRWVLLAGAAVLVVGLGSIALVRTAPSPHPTDARPTPSATEAVEATSEPPTATIDGNAESESVHESVGDPTSDRAADDAPTTPPPTIATAIDEAPSELPGDVPPASPVVTGSEDSSSSDRVASLEAPEPAQDEPPADALPATSTAPSPPVEPPPIATTTIEPAIESQPTAVAESSPSPSLPPTTEPAVSDAGGVATAEPIEPPDASPGGPPLYTEGEAGVIAPRPIERVAADYPRRARRQQIATQVVVAVLVDPDGRVIQTLLERRDRSGFGFNEAAESAARATRFEPASRNDVVGSMWTRLIFDFRP